MLMKSINFPFVVNFNNSIHTLSETLLFFIKSKFEIFLSIRNNYLIFFLIIYSIFKSKLRLLILKNRLSVFIQFF